MYDMPAVFVAILSVHLRTARIGELVAGFFPHFFLLAF